MINKLYINKKLVIIDIHYIIKFNYKFEVINIKCTLKKIYFHQINRIDVKKLSIQINFHNKYFIVTLQ